jgi:ferredoxin-type protein NapH
MGGAAAHFSTRSVGLVSVWSWAGIWLVKGNLNSSLTLGVLPLTDPYVLLQSLAARHWPYTTALIGAAIVTVFYAVVGGRVYCSWVCPINLVTDSAAWLRLRLGIRGGAHLPREARYWILAMTLVVAAATGTVAWEWINLFHAHRACYSAGIGAVVALVFLLTCLYAARWWGVLSGGCLLRLRSQKRGPCRGSQTRGLQ